MPTILVPISGLVYQNEQCLTEVPAPVKVVPDVVYQGRPVYVNAPASTPVSGA